MVASKVLGQWMTFYKYDDQGRLIMKASPSAVTGYDRRKDRVVDTNRRADVCVIDPGDAFVMRDRDARVTIGCLITEEHSSVSGDSN